MKLIILTSISSVRKHILVNKKAIPICNLLRILSTHSKLWRFEFHKVDLPKFLTKQIEHVTFAKKKKK